jgi:tetratricopeptide (TPR) repeat protein
LPRALDIHGRNLELLGRVGEAETALREAIRVRLEQTGGAETVAVAGLWSDLASVLHEQGRFEEAADRYRRSVELYEGAGRTAFAGRRNLGLELLELGRYDEAEPLTREALNAHLAQAPARNAAQRAKRNLARILHARARLEEAEAMMREALGEWAEDAGADHPEVARDTVYLAAIVADRGRVDEAIDLYRGAVQTLDRRLPACHHWTILAKLGAARVVAEHVSAEAAEPVLREALRDAMLAQPGSERLIADAAVGLGACLLAQERPQEAARVAEEALGVLDLRPPPGEALRAARLAALESLAAKAASPP